MSEDPRDKQADATFSREDYLQHEREQAEKPNAESPKADHDAANVHRIKHDLGLGDG